MGLLRTVDRFNPEARRARDSQFNRGDTLFDRYFGAFYPRLGKNSPDARFPAQIDDVCKKVLGTSPFFVHNLSPGANYRSAHCMELMKGEVFGPLGVVVRERWLASAPALRARASG